MQIEGNRFDFSAEGAGMGEVLKSNIAGHQIEMLDKQARRPRAGRFRPGVRVRRQRQLAEVQRPIRFDQHPRERLLQQDRLKIRPPVPDARDRQVHQQMLISQHRLAIGIGQRKIPHIQSQRVGIEPDVAEADFPVIVLADKVVHARAQQAWNGVEPQNRIQQNEDQRRQRDPEQ